MKKILSAALGLTISAPSFASFDDDTWGTVSDVGLYSLLAAALAKPLVDIKGWSDVKSSWHGIAQAGASIGATTAITIVGQHIFDETAPNGKTKRFPSSHAANAFAAATHLHMRYGWEYGFPAYSVAALVGYGRVEARENDWKDVLVGAAVGSASAWFFTESKDRKVELMPWATTKEVGLSLAYHW